MIESALFDLIVTVAAGVALVVGGMSCGLWQILSAPDRPNYPTSGPFKRTVMFFLTVFLMGRGSEVVTLALREIDPLRMTAWQAGGAFLVPLFLATMLVDHLRHWLPAQTHRHIRRMLTIAQCPPAPGLVRARRRAIMESTGGPVPPADVVSPALVALSAQGVRIAAPNEGPEAFTH